MEDRSSVRHRGFSVFFGVTERLTGYVGSMSRSSYVSFILNEDQQPLDGLGCSRQPGERHSFASRRWYVPHYDDDSYFFFRYSYLSWFTHICLLAHSCVFVGGGEVSLVDLWR